MHNFKISVTSAVCAAALAMAGCSATTTANINATTAQAVSTGQQAFTAVCNDYSIADVAFQAALAIVPDKIPASVVTAEAIAVQTLVAVCANGTPTNLSAAIKTASTAYATISKALAAAHAAKTAAGA